MTEKPTYNELEQRVKELEAFEANREENVVALEHLFDLSLDLLCVGDMNANFKHINNAFEKTLGYTKEELLEESFLHFIHPSDIASTIAEFEKLTLGEPTIYFENRYRCRDNSYKWLAWTSMPNLEHGLMYAVARDITEHKVAAQALFESEERYRLLFNNMLSGFALHEIIYDKNGKPCDYRFLDLNPAFERVTGLRRIDILGKTVREVLPKIETYWINTYGEVVLSGKPVHFENYSEALDRYYEVVAFRSQKNQFAVIVTDITARIRSEEGLRESEERHRLLLEVSPDPIVIYDMEGKATYVNPAFSETFGWSRKELLGKRIDFVPEENWPETRAAIKRMIQGEKIQLFETKRLTKDNRKLDIQLSSSLFQGIDGKPYGNIVILRDITLQKQAEETIRKSHDELEQRVKERTAQLVSTTEKLQQEIKEHQRSEEALRKSRERFRSLTEVTSDWIWEVDKNGFYTYSSPKVFDILGYRAEEIVGKSPFDLMPSPEADQVFKIFNDIRASQKSFDCLENTNLHKNGHSVILETSGVPIFDTNGKFTGYRGIDRDITQRKRIQEELQKAHDELENRVKERTRELEAQKSNIEEANIALQVLLDKRHEDKKEMEDNVLMNVKEMMIPYFKKIRKTKLNVHQKTILSILESYLNEIVSPFTRKISRTYLNLTPVEIEVANLIRFGSNSKEIADIMGLSPRTIYNHRKNIRKKLGIENKKTDLRSYLLSIF
jgi:PAS domain S-box-containing protein